MVSHVILVGSTQEFKRFRGPLASERFQMEGTELLVLQACSRVAADEFGFVLDADLARHTHMSITDVRDYLENLEQNGFISLVRLENPDGLKAKVQAKGRTELSKSR
jgi:hypothetical protein